MAAHLVRAVGVEDPLGHEGAGDLVEDEDVDAAARVRLRVAVNLETGGVMGGHWLAGYTRGDQ